MRLEYSLQLWRDLFAISDPLVAKCLGTLACSRASVPCCDGQGVSQRAVLLFWLKLIQDYDMVLPEAGRMSSLPVPSWTKRLEEKNSCKTDCCELQQHT